MSENFFWYRDVRYRVLRGNTINVPSVGEIHVGPPYPKLGRAIDIGAAVRKLQRTELQACCARGYVPPAPRIALTSITRLTHYHQPNPFPMVGDPAALGWVKRRTGQLPAATEADPCEHAMRLKHAASEGTP